MKIPPLSTLRAFEAAARLGSFKAAADELALTPAAVSRSIARLEDELGLALFHRAHRAVSLTEAGARYAAQIAEGLRCLSRGPRAPDGPPRLTLEVEATFLRQWLMPRLALPSFEELGLSPVFGSHDTHPRVIPSGAEVAITWGFADYPGFRRQRLVTPRTFVAGAKGSPVSLDLLASATLLHETDDHWWRLVCAEAGISFPEAARSMTFDRCDMPILAAREGLGLAVADDVCAENLLRRGEIAPLPAPQFDSQDYFLLIRRTASVPARRFANWLSDRAAEFAAWQRTFWGTSMAPDTR